MIQEYIIDRVRSIMEYYNSSPSAFADEIGVQRSSISHILSGRNKPSLDLVQKVLFRYPEIDPGWLLSGKGDMIQLNLFEQPVDLPAKKERIASTDKKVIQNNTSVIAEKIVQSEQRSEQFEAFSREEASNTELINSPIVDTVKNTAAIISSVKPVEINSTKKIQRIMIFYDDNTFAVYNPE